MAEIGGPRRSPDLFQASEGLAAFLEEQDLSLLFTSYQTGRLYVLGRRTDGRLDLSYAPYPQATGLAAEAGEIVLASGSHIVRFAVLPTDANPSAPHDLVLVPRVIHTVGLVETHQIGIGSDGTIYFVNTLYNCICTLHEVHSFKPVWKPAFISDLVAEDRCHLNGLAMDEGRPAFATAFGGTDAKHGWRDRDFDGIVLSIAENEVIAGGLAMPHSPRLHGGRLWIANSGTGEFGYVDWHSGRFVPIAFVAGYLRGTALCGDFAILSVSTFRQNRSGHVGLERRIAEAGQAAWCGLEIISLKDGRHLHSIRLDGAVAELFDVTILPGVRHPKASSQHYKDIQDHLSSAPPSWAAA